MAETTERSGPLAGVRALELGGIGPGPFAAMMLADMGAEVIRVDRPGAAIGLSAGLHRGRRSVAMDLKDGRAIDVVGRIVEGCDVVLEGFRPGVAERLGLGPDDLIGHKPSLVYGRMTGWGQSGPLARTAGHDINYISLSGALHAIGPRGADPVPPLNLVGDFGGGGMFLAYGVVCALLHSRLTGRGQVVDAAMVDGASALLAMQYGLLASGVWRDERGVNLLDGGAPFYRTYRCADGRHMAVGCIEPEFYAEFLRILGLTDDPVFVWQMDQAQWPDQHRRLEEMFAGRPRDEWAKLFEGSDACTTPVLSLLEAAHHPHNQIRGTFRLGRSGTPEPMPAPRFSLTPTGPPESEPAIGRDTYAVLSAAGLSADEIDSLREAGVIAIG